ncbi:MAG: HmuY family protein, partial [Candidatus Nitrospinota bacterium M3_3B_026]
RLAPGKRVYVVRTSGGHYAKMRILDYYCGGMAACYSLEYVYQGAGGRSFKSPERGKNVSRGGDNLSRRAPAP